MVSNRRRRSVLIRVGLGLLGVLWLFLASQGGPAIGSLSSVQSNDASTFLPADAESTRAADAVRGLEATGTLPAFLLVERPSGVTPADLAAAQELSAGLPTLAAGDEPLQTYLAGEASPPVPSQDGKAVLVAVSLDAAAVTAPGADGETPLATVVDALRSAALAQFPGAQTWVTGPAGLSADLSSAFGAIDGVLLFVALGAVLVILVLVYRSPVLPFAVLLTSVFALSLAGLVVYHLAASDVLALNGQSQGILSILVVGAATDYGLLLVSRYREELRLTASARTALWRAWRAALEPIAASGATVVIGLLCLLLSSLNSNRSLGPVAAIGIVAALLSALTFLPVLLLGGRWLFWPRIPRATAAAPAGTTAGTPDEIPATTVATPARPARRGIWDRVAGVVERHARRTWIVCAVVLAAFAAFFPTFQADGVSQSDTFLSSVESVEGSQVLAEHFPAGSGEPAEVVVAAADAGAATRVAGSVAGIDSVAAGPANATTAVVNAVLSDGPDSPAATETVQRLRTALAGADVPALVGGTTATQLDTLDAARHDRALIIPVVGAAVFVVLVLLLRSILAAAVLMACTVLSYAATVGIAALVFDHVLGFPGADPVVPLYAFVFLVALGVDYSIFLMTRVREESVHHGTRVGTLRGLRATGGVITSAGVVLATTFAALAVVPLLFLAQIAFLVAFGVLLDTLLVRSFLVPALAHDLGDRVWWPSRLRPSGSGAAPRAARHRTAG
ncbi:MMPL family transporter [Kineococcus rubinsiae]|uniref:MMPL family transporter n=1 Tax=Kineococcus rubinsiae TaxID=2609562 RepID=UPI0014305B6C|nr:MMPL family transporter [Kineococcus rubinsiae]NIZ92192.1 MMPL family transporter [Kineococcus rubinsiae]